MHPASRNLLVCLIASMGAVAIAACSSSSPDSIGDGTSDSDAGSSSGHHQDASTGTMTGDDDATTGTGADDAAATGSTDASPGTHDSGGSTTDAAAAKDAAAPTGDSGSGFDQFQQHNLDVVNMYRAMLGAAPLTLDAKLCTFALAGSNELMTDHMPHQHFITVSQTDNGKGLFTGGYGFKSNAGENQGDPNGWNVINKNDPTLNELGGIDAIQKAMFDEGPGAGEAHGHYENIVNTKFKRLGVGLVEVNKQLYLTNDFSD